METLKRFQPGDLIFKQGDDGDALFLIQEGQVEITKKSGANEVFLTLQNPGEIIGLLSFFHSGQRLASARARTEVEGILVDRKGGRDPLANLPGWVQLVLKDFSVRLSQVNDQVVQLQSEKSGLIAAASNRLTRSVQIADTAAEVGRFFVKKVDGNREVVPIAPLLEAVERCLGYDPAEVADIFNVFTNLGMVKVEADQDTKQEIMAVGNLARLKWFTEFVRSSKSGKNRKMVQTEIPFKFRKVLFALRDYVQKTQGDIQKLNALDFALLLNDFEKHTKVKPEAGAFDIAASVGLIEIKKSGKDQQLIVNPTLLVRTLISINVIKRLKTDPQIKDFEDQAV